MKKITQVEGRRLRKEVEALKAIQEGQRRWWANEWPEGVHVAGLVAAPDVMASIATARKLGHAIVAWTNSGRVEFAALPLPTEKVDIG